MTKAAALGRAERLYNHTGLFCTVTRILPIVQDPIVQGDDGWDVLVSVTVHDIS